jgi:hypothetical protein
MRLHRWLLVAALVGPRRGGGRLRVVASSGARASPNGPGRALLGLVLACSVPVLAGRLAVVVLLHQGRWWPEFCSSDGNSPALPRLDHLGLRSGELGWCCGGGKHCPSPVTVLLLAVVVASSLLVSVSLGKVCARVKTLLGASVASHGNACGCHFLLGGVVMGLTSAPPPSMLLLRYCTSGSDFKQLE